jgi:hypothetical protein
MAASWCNYYGTATDLSFGWSNCTASTYAISDMKAIYKQWNKMASTYPVEMIERIPSVIPAGKRQMEMPDGSKIIIDDLGNYRIEDKEAKVTYKANRVREFSPHLNASDMVAKFVEYVGRLGLKQREMLNLPIQLFINWLVIEAAERDSDPIPEGVVPVAKHPLLIGAIRPKCLCCGRFIRRLNIEHRFPFCSPEHGAIYVQKQTPRIEQPSHAPALAN